MPLYTNIAGRPGPGPLEADPTSSAEGAAATAASAFIQAPGITAIEAGVGAASGGPQLSHDDAVKALGKGYDGSSIPQSGINAGVLDMIRERQDSLQANESIAARSDMTTPERFIASLVGGLPDPVNLAATALAPEAKGASLGARLLRGAGEGAGIMAAGVGLQTAVHGYVGDPDVRMGDAFRDVALGALTGGVSHAALGTRVSTDDIAALERSPAAAKAQGVSVDEVTSPKGAVGLHQVEPTTAMQMGFGKTPEEAAQLLKDPKINKEASGKYLDFLAEKFPGDPEAQAVAYNGGPGRAAEWIKAGRDVGVLPKETQDYLARYREIKGAGEAGAAKVATIKPEELRTAIMQAAHDSPVNVEPVADHSADLSAAVPKPNASMDAPRDFTPEDMMAKPVGEWPTTGPGPLEAQATEHLKDAMAETKDLHESLGQEMAPEVAERDEEIKNTDEFTKAVKAAVQCGMRRGLD